jgi:hypothetical protein
MFTVAEEEFTTSFSVITLFELEEYVWRFGITVRVEEGGRSGVSPRRKQRDQERAILKTIKKLRYNPIALPADHTSGKRGIKDRVRSKLKADPLFSAPSAFEKAWERLLKQRLIARASLQKPTLPPRR